MPYFRKRAIGRYLLFSMSICLWQKRRNRNLHIKRVCGVCVYFYLQFYVFFQAVSIHAALSHFFAANMSYQLALRNVILSYTGCPTGLFTSCEQNVDHIENLMALSILRVTEDSSRIEMDVKWWASKKRWYDMNCPACGVSSVKNASISGPLSVYARSRMNIPTFDVNRNWISAGRIW